MQEWFLAKKYASRIITQETPKKTVLTQNFQLIFNEIWIWEILNNGKISINCEKFCENYFLHFLLSPFISQNYGIFKDYRYNFKKISLIWKKNLGLDIWLTYVEKKMAKNVENLIYISVDGSRDRAWKMWFGETTFTIPILKGKT